MMESSVVDDIFFLYGKKFTENEGIVNLTAKSLKTIEDTKKKWGDKKYELILNKSRAKVQKCAEEITPKHEKSMWASNRRNIKQKSV